MANPKDSMRMSVMLAALREIIARAPARPDNSWLAADDSTELGLWEAAEIARKALDTVGLPHKETT